MGKREMKIKNIIVSFLFIFLIFSVIKGAEREDELKQANTFVTQYILGCKDCIDKAIEIYNSIITDIGVSEGIISKAKIGLARAYYAKKEYEKAARLYEDALKSDNLTITEQEKVLYQLGYIKYLMKEYEEAKEIFEKVKNDFIYTGQESKVPYAVYMAGRCYEAEGNTEGARIKYQEVIKDYPDHSASQYAEQGLGK